MIENDFDSAEFLDDDAELSLLEQARRQPEIPLIRIDQYVLPFIQFVMELEDLVDVATLRRAMETNGFVGFSYNTEDDEFMPRPKSVGVAARVVSIEKTDYGDLHLVRIEPQVRYFIDFYVQNETNEDSAIVKVTYFEDDEEPVEDILPHVAEFNQIAKELNKFVDKQRRRMDWWHEATIDEAYIFSFAFWRVVDPKPESRQVLQHLTSTSKRLHWLNKCLDVFRLETEMRFPARFN